MTGLEDRFAVIMRAVYGLVMRKWGSKPASCSTVSTPILVWSLFHSGRMQQIKSPASVQPVQAKSGHEPIRGSMPWPPAATERVGCNATNTGTGTGTSDIVGIYRVPPWRVFVLVSFDRLWWITCTFQVTSTIVLILKKIRPELQCWHRWAGAFWRRWPHESTMWLLDLITTKSDKGRNRLGGAQGHDARSVSCKWFRLRLKDSRGSSEEDSSRGSSKGDSRGSSEEDSSRGLSKGDAREGQVKKTLVEGRAKKAPERVK
jgi:hypothetical protein